MQPRLEVVTDTRFPVSVPMEKGAALSSNSPAIILLYSVRVLCGVDTNPCVPICNRDSARIDIAVMFDRSRASIGPIRRIEGISVEFFVKDGSGTKANWHLTGHAAHRGSSCQDT